MNFKATFLIFVILSFCNAEGFSLHKYHRYRKRQREPKIQQDQNDQKNPVNICPPVVCPFIAIPEKCRKETFTNVYGILCKGCDQNICENDSGDKKYDFGPKRGDIPEVPKFLNGQNDLQWIDTTPNQNQLLSNSQWGANQGPNNVFWQNNMPVWQNDISGNTQWQNNAQSLGNMPINAQWQDNTLQSNQWQNNIPTNIQWQNLPVDTQWQNNALLNNQWQNTALLSNQWQNNGQESFPVGIQFQNGQSGTFDLGPSMTTSLGNVVQSVPPANQWANGPFQTQPVNNQWQNVPLIPSTGSSLPVFQNDRSIGTPISGLPMQITGKSVNSPSVRMESDQNLGFTNPLYDALPFGNDIGRKVYDANSPDAQASAMVLPAGGKK